MLTPADRRRFLAEPVARLATVRPDGRPHVVPITFTIEADDLVTAVDHKPKRHDRLQRLANIQSEPRVSVLVDRWTADWDDLWWLRADGIASVRDRDDTAVDALSRKYRQYADRPPEGPVIRMTIERVVSWSASA